MKYERGLGNLSNKNYTYINLHIEEKIKLMFIYAKFSI